MTRLKLLLLLGFLLVPVNALAWGPLTHIYLGSEILSLAPVLPAALYGLLRRYKEDYLYGNLMADIILGKKFLPYNRNSHSWDVAFKLMDVAETDQQKAFVYGYMSHLAADTVAHEKLTSGLRHLGHTVFELKSDSLVGRKYWFRAVSIRKKVRRRNDSFLESTLESPFLSVRTNKRIYQGMVLLTYLTPKRMNEFIDRTLFLPHIPDSDKIKSLHECSRQRILDILTKGECSDVIGNDPVAHISTGGLGRFFRSTSMLNPDPRKKAGSFNEGHPR